MNITCKPIRQIHNNPSTGFRVLACQCVGDYPPDLELNSYGNFTLSGSNINTLSLYNEYTLEIRKNHQNKYEASYVVIGFAGIEIGETITVDPNEELSMLQGIMSYGQACNVHEAYPDFIQKVLNNQEAEIDYKKIYGVGPVYLESYIDKIKASYKSIFFTALADEWDIRGDAHVNELVKNFLTPDEAKKAIDNNPYAVFVDIVNYGFETADKKIIKKMPHMIDSPERCVYGVLKVLKDNEGEGDTRIPTKTLANMVREYVPECAHHVANVVKNHRLIHHDVENKTAAIEETFKNEQAIAWAITERVHNPIKYDMDYEQFREVDGFSSTDEQVEILKLANEQSVALLTGSAGTGKTTCTKALILMLEHYMKSYLLLAPTGIAAKRMKESTGRPASTIHMFLARDGHFSGDYLIIDEISMCAVDILANLFTSISPETKIIMIGDAAQLPSISCGNVLQDMIDSGIVPRADLTRVFRYGIGAMDTVITDIRKGHMYLNKDGSNNFEAVEQNFKFTPLAQKKEDVIPQIIDVYEKYIDMGYNMKDIMVLTPKKVSDLGTYKINEAIQNRFNPHVFTGIEYERDGIAIRFKVGDKVVNIKNNYHMKTIEEDENGHLTPSECEARIMNGDIGFIRDCVTDEELGTYFIIQYDNDLVMAGKNEISDLILGYALTIHRVQGAQAKIVVTIISPLHMGMLNRNILYTGNSRVREELEQIGDIATIEKALAIEATKLRDTWLKDLLIKFNEEWSDNHGEEED